jgi:hypothetical protein
MQVETPASRRYCATKLALAILSPVICRAANSGYSRPFRRLVFFFFVVGSAPPTAFPRIYSPECVSAPWAMIAKICLTTFGCNTAPLWKGTITLSCRLP